MRWFGLFILLFAFPLWSEAHPLHLSVTNITYENGKLKISMKTFRDDWETAYFHYHGEIIDFIPAEQRKIPWFAAYLNERFKLSVDQDDNSLSLNIHTTWLDEESMTIEMECSVPAKANSLYIYNALLTDIYPDQTNLLIFGFKKKETGIKFDVLKLDAEVPLK